MLHMVRNGVCLQCTIYTIQPITNPRNEAMYSGHFVPNQIFVPTVYSVSPILTIETRLVQILFDTMFLEILSTLNKKTLAHHMINACVITMNITKNEFTTL